MDDEGGARAGVLGRGDLQADGRRPARGQLDRHPHPSFRLQRELGGGGEAAGDALRLSRAQQAPTRSSTIGSAPPQSAMP
jgi:hypothetical protein